VNPSNPTSASSQRPSLSGWGLLAALVVLVAFGVFIAFLVTQREAPETPWTRLAWLFASVEAIAFGAAGALFGSSIQRQRAEKAEEEARQNSDTAARGRALAAVIKADDPDTDAGRANLESFGPTEATNIAARHASIARELFP
jgi:hypothetical protein